MVVPVSCLSKKIGGVITDDQSYCCTILSILILGNANLYLLLGFVFGGTPGDVILAVDLQKASQK